MPSEPPPRPAPPRPPFGVEGVFWEERTSGVSGKTRRSALSARVSCIILRCKRRRGKPSPPAPWAVAPNKPPICALPHTAGTGAPRSLHLTHQAHQNPGSDCHAGTDCALWSADVP